MPQGTEHHLFLQQPSVSSHPGVDVQGGTVRAGMLRASPIDSSKNATSMGASRTSEKGGSQHKPHHKTEKEKRLSGSSERTIRQETVAPGEKRSETEVQKQQVNVIETLSSLDQRKEREREITADSAREISREDVQHEVTITEGDSAYPRVTRLKNEWRFEKAKEKGVWRASGTVTEPPTGTAREENMRRAVANAFVVVEDMGIQNGHWTPEVRRSTVIGQLKEPLQGRLVNRLSEWKKIGGDKQVSRGRSGEAHFRVGGEVVQSDIHGDKEERKVEKDTRLQGAKQGSAGKAFQDGFPGDSVGTPGGERLDDYARHIECLSTCQSGRAVQSLSVLQLSKAMLHLRGDAIWSKGRPQKKEETKDERPCSTPLKVELRETATPTSEFVDDAYAIRAEACNSPRRLERDGDSQPNDTGRINTLEKDTTRKQTKESEEKDQTSRANNGRFRDGMGCSINNTDREQRGEDFDARKLDPPGECVSDKRKGAKSSVEDFRKEKSMAATTEDRSYLSDYRKHVHKMDDREEEGRAIAHSNTENI
ncbi:uncharacterized protein MONOS_6834 [Monocercomonoides exilis]|uniref:uncharacterized protein n=1 Tax=Monocercomonoides exilis TaxID=2049356 RepID=UPI00355A8FF0|nr:hypothetical protein MONOS_6834 [Monocercomonoides exilis]|eukprot:MONOS_6834.1-p1 / transcript=MONOS_6834.1 / gene=MONOS_6834 / organism=Monocercomonoides_exilis_PA203 / gene_product=unspecified product / transcript_product=unspecified product / location=Mono_scaffold00223:20437-22671(-) / protein_length=537 / sequence_SO=supercontig / SO=protein_coding / is_pseudo=false